LTYLDWLAEMAKRQGMIDEEVQRFDPPPPGSLIADGAP